MYILAKMPSYRSLGYLQSHTTVANKLIEIDRGKSGAAQDRRAGFYVYKEASTAPCTNFATHTQDSE